MKGNESEEREKMKDKRKKILFIHHGISNAGAARSLYFLIEQIDREKYEPYIMYCCDEKGNRELFRSLGVPMYYEKYMAAWHGSVVSGMGPAVLEQNIHYAISTYISMRKRIRKIDPDLVHLNSTCLWIQAKAIKKYNPEIPIVCHVREPLLNGIWGDILRRGCNKYVDEFIAIEKYDALSLGKTDKPVNIIYNFVDFSIYYTGVKSDCLRRELHIGENEIIFLYLARVTKQNGALEMLRALDSYLYSEKKVHLCIVGADLNRKNKYSKQVLQEAEKFKNVHVLPFRKDVSHVISSSDVMLVPFQEPHFARSIIEAAAMGVPSIATDIPGPQELIKDGETGYLVDRVLDGLEEKCRLLAKDAELRKKMGSNAERYARENFDAEKNASRTFEVYKKLLEQKQ